MDRPQSDCAHVHETSAHRVDIARQLHAEDGWHCEDVLVGMRGEDEVARFEAGPFACSLHPAYDLVTELDREWPRPGHGRQRNGGHIRSDERRVGTARVSTCRSRSSPAPHTQTNTHHPPTPHPDHPPPT